MSYRQLTVDNRSALKRFSHRRRFLKAVDLLAAADGQRVLDYGSGDGHMLALLGQRWPRCELVGYDPMPAQFDQLQQNVRGTPIEAKSAEQVNAFLARVDKGASVALRLRRGEQQFIATIRLNNGE
jgi:trans-aconitate methyltransferase